MPIPCRNRELSRKLTFTSTTRAAGNYGVWPRGVSVSPWRATMRCDRALRFAVLKLASGRAGSDASAAVGLGRTWTRSAAAATPPPCETGPSLPAPVLSQQTTDGLGEIGYATPSVTSSIRGTATAKRSGRFEQRRWRRLTSSAAQLSRPSAGVALPKGQCKPASSVSAS